MAAKTCLVDHDGAEQIWPWSRQPMLCHRNNNTHPLFCTISCCHGQRTLNFRAEVHEFIRGFIRGTSASGCGMWGACGDHHRPSRAVTGIFEFICEEKRERKHSWVLIPTYRRRFWTKGWFVWITYYSYIYRNSLHPSITSTGLLYSLQ